MAQQRQWRCSQVDSHYAAAIFKYMQMCFTVVLVCTAHVHALYIISYFLQVYERIHPSTKGCLCFCVSRGQAQNQNW